MDVVKRTRHAFKRRYSTDDPGLGKTIQTLAIMLLNSVSRTLIIVPNAVLSQWKEAIEHVFGENSVYVHHGNHRVKTNIQLYTIPAHTKIVLTIA